MATEERPLNAGPPETGEGAVALPLLALRDIVVFPYMVVPLLVGRRRSIEAVSRAMEKDRIIFLAAQKDAAVEEPGQKDIYGVGVIAEILQLVRQPDGSLKILVEGQARGRIQRFLPDEGALLVEVVELPEETREGPEIEALMRSVRSQFEQYCKLNPRLPAELSASISNIRDPGRLADAIAAHLSSKVEEKQKVLEAVDPGERLRRLAELLGAEMEIAQLEVRIQGQVRKQMEKTQKEYYLQEQMRAIQKELGKMDELAEEAEELREAIRKAKMPKEVEAKALREVDKLAKMMSTSPEATVVRNYLDWLVSLPWSKRTRDRLDIGRAKRILDEDHYGLTKPKERILEYLAVRKLVKNMRGPILCFVGPPGVGKTSLGRSIARALGRNFVRMSLGGVRDEAEIRGHRRTYIGALPGRIIQGMRKAGSRNPVFLLDEVDKMSMDFRGDPSAALLEVLDPEQNSTFSDHYLEVEFDLSDVMFITTANIRDAIPPPLLDRMEVIELPGYTDDEKIKIATRFLLPKQLEAHGLKPGQVVISENAVQSLIRGYTREAGVRNLERELASVLRKVARRIAEDGKTRRVRITAASLEKYLGPRRFVDQELEAQDLVGLATGLAWTEAGGELLPVEVSVLPGKGNLLLTGKLGEVMKESAQAAVSFVRSRAESLGIPKDFFEERDIHIHVPEGAIPKDGPSAGITMAVALASAATGRPVRRDVAMTGEITLRGRVLAIGGLKPKVLAAHRSGTIKKVLFPKANEKDLPDIPPNVRRQVELVPVSHMDEVLELALVPGDGGGPRKGAGGKKVVSKRGEDKTGKSASKRRKKESKR